LAEARDEQTGQRGNHIAGRTLSDCRHPAT
jgi:hypothetical protein